jgi:hypothetical protein
MYNYGGYDEYLCTKYVFPGFYYSTIIISGQWQIMVLHTCHLVLFPPSYHHFRANRTPTSLDDMVDMRWSPSLFDNKSINVPCRSAVRSTFIKILISKKNSDVLFEFMHTNACISNPCVVYGSLDTMYIFTKISNFYDKNNYINKYKNNDHTDNINKHKRLFRVKFDWSSPLFQSKLRQILVNFIFTTLQSMMHQ